MPRCFSPRRNVLSHTACASRYWFFSVSLVSNVKNVDPGKFPMHYCYCLNNVTNDLTGGYTREGDNCMCLSWIISFGAESCSLNSADFILTSGITIPRSTAITHEWLLWTSGETGWTQSQMAAPSPPVWDGAISQVTGMVYPMERPPFPPRNTKSSLVGKTTWQYMIRYFSHFRSPEITHRRWTRASLHQQTPITSTSPIGVKSKD